ncbi:hypothetical protein STEG23_022981 [Scotinomys teguina]
MYAPECSGQIGSLARALEASRKFFKDFYQDCGPRGEAQAIVSLGCRCILDQKGSFPICLVVLYLLDLGGQEEEKKILVPAVDWKVVLATWKMSVFNSGELETN